MSRSDSVVFREVVREVCQVFVSMMLFLGVFSQANAYVEEAPDTIEGARTISTSQAKLLFDSGAVFIDVRSEQEWEHGRIQGALHLDFEDDFIVLYVSQLLDRNTPIVFYCNSPLSNRGAMASFFAATWGYSNIYFYRQGYFSWLAYDLPVEYQHESSGATVGLNNRSSLME